MLKRRMEWLREGKDLDPVMVYPVAPVDEDDLFAAYEQPCSRPG